MIPSSIPHPKIVRLIGHKVIMHHPSLCNTSRIEYRNPAKLAYRANMARPATPTTPTTLANAVGTAAAPVYAFGVALVATASVATAAVVPDAMVACTYALLEALLEASTGLEAATVDVATADVTKAGAELFMTVAVYAGVAVVLKVEDQPYQPEEVV